MGIHDDVLEVGFCEKSDPFSDAKAVMEYDRDVIRLGPDPPMGFLVEALQNSVGTGSDPAA
jgi:hypothetical protein